jgi:hypothetical protein
LEIEQGVTTVANSPLLKKTHWRGTRLRRPQDSSMHQALLARL